MYSRWVGVKFCCAENSEALSLVATESVLIPSKLYKPETFILPISTPIDPVIVLRSATIFRAGAAIQYPPDAATSDIETTTGFTALASSTSRRITSLPTTEPPPESTRSTMALMFEFCRAERMSRATESPPITDPPPGVDPESPETISPEACPTAIVDYPSFLTDSRY